MSPKATSGDTPSSFLWLVGLSSLLKVNLVVFTPSFLDDLAMRVEVLPFLSFSESTIVSPSDKSLSVRLVSIDFLSATSSSASKYLFVISSIDLLILFN